MKPQHCSVVVIGAGESGIAVGCQLKSKLGVTDFRIFDRQGGVGGAWYINRYPGVACDIPALFFSYSFAPNYVWTSLFPPGQEIQQYLALVASKYGLEDNIELNTEVTEAQWLPDTAEWEVRVTRLVPFAGDLSEAERQRRVAQHGRASVYLEEEVVRAKVLITCAGELVEPNAWPAEVPGIETFQGEVMHSARWRDDVDLEGKNVVVVGTGCTSAQLVPTLLETSSSSKATAEKKRGRPKHVTQLMRSAAWYMARPTPPPASFNRMMTVIQLIPGLGRLFRLLLFLYAESTWLNIGMGALGITRRRRFQNSLLAHMRKMVPEKYHAMLTPSFGVGCKRIIIDDGWLDCLSLHDRFELTTRPLVSVGETTVTLGPSPEPGDVKGASDPVTQPTDVIVLANGFETSTYLHRVTIRNGAGQSLRDAWRAQGGPGAYMSTAVHGFPNLFMVLGPNAVSGHSSAILASENIAGYVLPHFVSKVLSGEARTVEVKEDAERRYTTDVQRKSRDKVWQGCRGGYIAESGWNSSICPYNQIHFSMMCKYPKWQDWDIEYTAIGKDQLQKPSYATYLFVMVVVLTVACVHLLLRSK
ncbi:FAD/NAD(P)-binding domain-containing protein [Apiospora saccharicola]|uniref:FAD/NAD(P)-binding domain-containing protein n=1 Tax=Apiospora saccharicola TaxID=335842 RepID=A0ABR1W474_9PEZI